MGWFHLFNVNLPRPTFVKRAFFPLAAISRIMAEQIVAQGVAPPDFQYPFSKATSTISRQVIGCLDSARTLAAASSPLVGLALWRPPLFAA